MFSKKLFNLAFISTSFLAVPAIALAQDAPAADAAAPAVEQPAKTELPAKSAELDFSKLPEPMSFAKAQYAEALKLNALPPSADRDTKIRAFADALVDYDDVAQRSMGEKLSAAAPEKQAEFKALFRELLELTYLKRLSDKAFKDNYKIDWDRVSKTKTSAIVSCFTRQKDVETELEMILHAAGNSWEVYDVLVDGASLAKTYQKKYAKKIDQKGIDGLIADMKAEIAKLKKK